MEKAEALVYDATAGNRTMYVKKDHPLVFYGDVEPDLSFPPDGFVDCRDTGFPDKSKYLIIFDPPHEYGQKKNQGIFNTPSKELHDRKWPQHRCPKGLPRYYGLDKFQTKKELKQFLYEAQREFHRILADGGALLFKWSERSMRLDEVLQLFPNWCVLLKIRCYQRLLMMKDFGPVQEAIDVFYGLESPKRRRRKR